MLVRATAIATGIKSERMGIKPLPTFSPVLLTDRTSRQNMMEKEEKLPVQERSLDDCGDPRG